MENYIIKITPPDKAPFYYHPRGFPKSRDFAWKMSKEEAKDQVKVLKTVSPNYKFRVQPE